MYAFSNILKNSWTENFLQPRLLATHMQHNVYKFVYMIHTVVKYKLNFDMDHSSRLNRFKPT